MISPAFLLEAVAGSLAAAGIAQSGAGLLCVRRFMRQAAPRQLDAALPAITVLKPLHGAEPMLEQALETFFLQDYPALQLVFGVQRTDDPAIAIVAALCQRHPRVAAHLVVNPTPHGKNRKIANLINMLPYAAHDLLVISDSDMHVAPDYLRQVAAPFAAPDTGLVTSLYVGLPSGRATTAQLGAAYINQIFAAGAVMARALGRRDCLGATMAVRRDTLLRVGGLEALSPYVADDAVLGRLVRAQGLRVRLAATVPATTVAEAGLAGLLSHELRWGRTIRAMAPLGYAASAVQFPIFWALLSLAAGLAAAANPLWPVLLLAAALLARAWCGRQVERALGAALTPLWLVPVRDLLSVGVMAGAFTGNRVAWRGQVMSIAPDRAMALVRTDEMFAAQAVLAHGKG